MEWYYIALICVGSISLWIVLSAVFYKIFFKRFYDIVFSLLILICFFWLYIILAILVKINLGSPIIFCQERPGRIDKTHKKEKIFKLYKFRSMTNKCDENGNLLSDSQRLTRFGKILRSLSLDELPELFNILKGDMSFVGPRPLLPKYLGYYNDYEHQRHLVRPGLTGLAQISGRNTASWKDRFDYDVKYVNNVNMFFDIAIIFKTIKKVLKREGIEFKENHQSMTQYFQTRITPNEQDKKQGEKD